MSRVALCHVCLCQHFHPVFPILRLHRIALFLIGNTVKAIIALQNPRDFRLIVLARAAIQIGPIAANSLTRPTVSSTVPLIVPRKLVRYHLNSRPLSLRRLDMGPRLRPILTLTAVPDPLESLTHNLSLRITITHAK